MIKGWLCGKHLKAFLSWANRPDELFIQRKIHNTHPQWKTATTNIFFKNKDCDKWISDRKYFVLNLNSILKLRTWKKKVFVSFLFKYSIKEINKTIWYLKKVPWFSFSLVFSSFKIVSSLSFFMLRLFVFNGFHSVAVFSLTLSSTTLLWIAQKWMPDEASVQKRRGTSDIFRILSDAWLSFSLKLHMKNFHQFSRMPPNGRTLIAENRFTAFHSPWIIRAFQN